MLKSIATLPQTPMAVETTKMLAQLTIMSMRSTEAELENIRREIASDFGFQVFSKRLENRLKVHVAVSLFIVSELCDSPADVVMYAHAIYTDAKARDALEEEYTLTNFCMLFMNGFPTNEERRKAWDAQKCERQEGFSDNLIDNFANW